MNTETIKTWCGRAVLLLALASLTWPADVAAQNGEGMTVILERMGRLERDIRSLNLSLARGKPAPTQPRSAPGAAPAAAPVPAGGGNVNVHATARLNARLASLENDLRSSTGTLEGISYQVSEVAKRLDKLVGDVDYRLGVLEGRAPGTAGAQTRPARPPQLSAAPAPPPVQRIIPGQAASFAQAPGNLGTVSQKSVSAISNKSGGDQSAAPAPAAAAKPAPVAPVPVRAPSILPTGTAKDQYKFAFGLLRQANYDKAELALQEFVKQHPKDKLVSNARYWLGETYYVRAAYVQAAEVFLESYSTDPKGNKAPDSLLKLGMSLAGLDKKREACAAFDKLIKDYPKVSSGVKNTVRREKQKNSCS